MARRAISVELAASAVEGSTILTVPEVWLAKIPDNRNVFTSLYFWLKEEHGIEEAARRDLHLRTFAGKALMTRLLAAETKRIKRRHKLTGPKLKSAVSWSNLDSGPMESWKGGRLIGDALFIVPEGIEMNGDRPL